MSGFLDGIFGLRQGPDGPDGPQGPVGDTGPPADQVWLPNPLYPNPGEPALLAGGQTDWYDPWAHGDSPINVGFATPPAGIGPRLGYRREGPIVKFRGALSFGGGALLPQPLLTLRPGFRPEGGLGTPQATSQLFAGFILVSSTGAFSGGCHLDVNPSGDISRVYGETGSGRTIVGFEQIEFGITREPEELQFTHGFPGSSLGYAAPLDYNTTPRRPSDLGLVPPPALHSGLIDGEARRR